MSKLVVNT